MITDESTESLLRRISTLLGEHGETTWATAFDDLVDRYAESPKSTKAGIRSLYGGMGSFNDIVLHGSDGLPLREENERLDRLRRQLYAACRI